MARRAANCQRDRACTQSGRCDLALRLLASRSSLAVVSTSSAATLLRQSPCPGSISSCSSSRAFDTIQSSREPCRAHSTVSAAAMEFAHQVSALFRSNAQQSSPCVCATWAIRRLSFLLPQRLRESDRSLAFGIHAPFSAARRASRASALSRAPAPPRPAAVRCGQCWVQRHNRSPRFATGRFKRRA